MAREKPGDMITPASFAVAPELLGKPLARPGRRAAAMAIDLALLGLLVNAGALIFGVAAAFALWRASARTELAAGRPRLQRTFRLAAAGVLFLVVVSNWGFWTRPLHRLASAGEDTEEDADTAAFVKPDGGVKAGLATMGYFVALRNVKSEPEANSVARKLVRQLRSQGASASDLEGVRAGFEEQARKEKAALPAVAIEALEGAIAAEFKGDTARAPAAVGDRDSLASAYVRALARKDDGDARDTLGPMLGVAFAKDTLSDLNERIADLSADNRKLARRVRADSLKAARSPAGMMAAVSDAGGELVTLLRKAGLGFGWLGLYFTGFVAMMRGQTPGKWLMRIRIVRLDGRPMGWWAALERFGGYAASVVTALSGFFQILWDKNRQAMHDKIAETVVIRV